MAGNRILIVDSNVESRAWLVDNVTNPAGYVTAEATNHDEARTQITEFKPCAIMLNAQLDAAAGWKLLHELEDSIPVVVISAQRSLDLILAAMRAGARDVLVEPLDAEEVMTSLTRTLQTGHAIRDRAQTERRAQEINALYNIGKKVANLLKVEDILTHVISAAIDLTRAEEGSLLLCDTDSGELYLRANKNLDASISHDLHIKANDTLMDQVVHSRQPMMVNGSELHHTQTSFASKALLGVPLIAGKNVLGVLRVDNKRTDRGFDEYDMHLLSLLADYAAIALENANLYWSVENERVKFHSVLRNMEEAVIVVDSDTRIILINDAARIAFKLEDTALNTKLADAIDNQALLDLFDQRWRRESKARAEIPLSDGRTLQGQLSILPDIGFAAVMQDISHLKELDRIKSEFMGILSHDLRTPLTSIRGYIELLPRAGPLTDQQKKFIDNVDRNITNIVQLITDLLDIGRIEAGLDWAMESLKLETVINDVISSLLPNAASKKQQLNVDVQSFSCVLGNARRLEQVITNLIGNAIKYTPEDGQIDVTLTENQQFLVLSIKDNGIGISHENQARIFEKFYRVQSDETADIYGTGLGLSIVKSIIDKHNGRVWVESEGLLGNGSTFSILLPKHLS